MTGRKHTAPVQAQRIDEVLERGIFPNAKSWCVEAGVSESYLATLKRRIQRGEVESGKFPQMKKLAKAAHVSVLWIMGDDDESNMGLIGVPSHAAYTKGVRTRPNLAATLALNATKWKITTVAKALEYTEPTLASSAAAIKWWIKLLDAIEKGTK